MPGTDLARAFEEVAGIEVTVDWPTSQSTERIVRATLSPPHRRFDITLDLAHRGEAVNLSEESGWRCVGYSVRPRPAEDGRELPELTREEAEEIAGFLPAYRDQVAVQLVFSPQGQIEEAKALLRRGRAGLPKEFFEAISHEYRRHLAGGVPPTATIAAEFGVGRSTAASWIAGARKRGFLGPARAGEAGEAIQPVVGGATGSAEEAATDG